MAAAPTKEALTQLYTNTLRASRGFNSYNFRQYFVRRTELAFQGIQNEKDPAKLSAFYNERVKELETLKRSALVNQLYGGLKLVVEKEQPQDTLERSDN